MSAAPRPAAAVKSGEWSALAAYVLLIGALLAAAAAMLLDAWNAHAALADSRDALARLERSARPGAATSAAGTSVAEGPPFLAGPTITIGGASLITRVEAAARKYGARTLSSELDLQGPRARDGFITLSQNLEISQANLQPLLYDLEAGMPYLFVDDLEIESPQSFGEAEGAPMRVKIGVAGQWRQSK